MTTSQITLAPKTKFASIEAWAKAVGSAAKTRPGQRKAILVSFPDCNSQNTAARRAAHLDISRAGFRVRTGEEFDPRDGMPNHRNNATDYLARRTRARQERFAASHPLTLSMPAPATRADVEGDNTAEVSLLKLQEDRGYRTFARVGEWVIRTQEDVSWDNKFYSKAYNSRYGGKKTVDARTVLIRRVAADGTLDSRDQSVGAWRGNYLLDALIAAGVLESHKGQMNVRLHSAYALEIARKGRHLTIYARTLAGQTVDYCAVAGGVTFHAATVKEGIQGLRGKLRRVSLKANGQILDADAGRRLGFCETGMKAFAEDFDLDYRGAYTPAEIAAAVRRNASAAGKYVQELRTLAQATGYHAPELGD